MNHSTELPTSVPAPLQRDVLGVSVLATPSPSRGGLVVLEILEALAVCDVWSLQQEAEAVAAAYERSWPGALTGTTHISVVDGDGRCAALSSTLGSGSGVFRGGTQLNNMLGELDVIGAGERTPGERLPSMMTPTVVLDSGRPRLVIGSAGSVRLAGAIAQVSWRVLGGAPVADAIEAPRLHVEGSTLHLEGGWGDHLVAELPPKWDVVRWDGLNLYFGGVQAVERRSELVDPVDREAVLAQRVVLGAQLVALGCVGGEPEAADSAEGIARELLHPVERALGQRHQPARRLGSEVNAGSVVRGGRPA